MSTNAINPLHKHFRKPAIHLKLPSQGRFYPDGSLNLPVTGEIPVYPMTVKDELTLKTPDALMNGSGMTEVVRSCCPNILDPWQIPAVDVDAVFIAIRLASYGAAMDFNSSCPHCKQKNEHSIDLRVLLDNLHPANYNSPVQLDGLLFHFKPQNYYNINQTNIITFEERRIVDSIVMNESLTEDEKLAKFNESFEKLKQMNIDVVTASIMSISTDDGIVVTDQASINEYLDNCSRQVYDSIKQNIEDLIKKNKIDEVKLKCNECQKDYASELVFDQANFFA